MEDMFRHHHQTDEHLAATKAEVDALLQRLGRDVTNLDDGGQAINTQALADASERYETGSVQLAKSQSIGEALVARAIVVEGIGSTRGVRQRLGLDPGTEPPPAPSPEAPAEVHHSWGEALRGGGLGTAAGAGVAGGVLGLIGGSLLGGAMGEGDGGGDWGGGDGDFGGFD
jgi:hypothetical protein